VDQNAPNMGRREFHYRCTRSDTLYRYAASFRQEGDSKTKGVELTLRPNLWYTFNGPSWAATAVQKIRGPVKKVQQSILRPWGDTYVGRRD